MKLQRDGFVIGVIDDEVLVIVTLFHLPADVFERLHSVRATHAHDEMEGFRTHPGRLAVGGKFGREQQRHERNHVVVKR